MANGTKLCFALLLSLVSIDVLAQTRTWGSNFRGQIGDGNSGLTFLNNPTPVTIAGLSDVFAVTGGEGHSLVVKADGTVMTWGQGGQPSSLVPVPVTILTNVIAVSGGSGHSLALKSDGTVWAWGDNSSGQLGDFFSEPSSAVPVQVGKGQFVTTPGFDSIIAISAGLSHNLALKADGTVWAWGSNTSRQLGTGVDNSPSYSPSQISTALLSNVISISGGQYSSAAVKSDGTVWGWGNNGAGEIGDGTTTGPLPGSIQPTPTQALVSGVAQVVVADRTTVALKSDGTVWAWGYNEFGQLGNGTFSTVPQCLCEPTPMQTTISNVTDLRASSSLHTLARKRDGTIWAWGYNAEGEGGTGAISPQFPNHYSLPLPVQSLVGTGNVIFGTGRQHSLLSTPTIPVAAGANIVAHLGEATVTFASVAAAGNATITAIDPSSVALAPPAGFTIQLNAQAYDIATTATFTSAIVCIKVPMVFDQTAFSRLRILHVEAGVLVDRTSSRNYFRREVCGQVTSLSPFLMADSAAVAAPVFTAASARKMHGGVGTFDLALAATPLNPTTEPRLGPAHTIVLTFDKPVNAATASITEGVAVAAAPTFNGNEVVVALTGVNDQQYVTISLTNVGSTDGGSGGTGSVRVGFLMGDVNQNRVVTVSDVGLTNAQIAVPVSLSNFLMDINANGALTVSDKGLANSAVTHALPAP